MKRPVKYTLVVAAIITGLTALYFIFGFVRTPVIYGTVLDAETKQPIENAWVTATLSLKAATVQGDVHVHPSIAPPHLRTNKEGKFTIPQKSFRQPLPPIGFGMDVEGCSVSAETIDDKQGATDIVPAFWKLRAEVIVYVKPMVMTDAQCFAYLQSLYRYCTTGRSGVEIPTMREGCDTWELNYTIKKHEKFIRKLDGHEIGENRTFYKGSLYQLAYLLEQRGSLKESLDIFKVLNEHDKRHNISLWLKEYERKISELQGKLKQPQ